MRMILRKTPLKVYSNLNSPVSTSTLRIRTKWKPFSGTHRANFDSGGCFRCLPRTFFLRNASRGQPRERLSSETEKRTHSNHLTKGWGIT